MQGDYLLRPLQESEIEEAADMTALAFMISPGYHYIFEGLNDSERHTALKWLFSRNISLRLPWARCACAWDDSQKKEVMVCFFMLQPPDAGEISVWAMLMNGILIMPFLFGLKSFRRLLEVKNHHDEIDRLAQSTHGLTGQYCTLERMVVHPKWQGKGVGSRCLAQGLKEAALRQQGVILFTQEARNVTFYSRLGFIEVHREEDHPFRPTNSTTPVFNAVMVNTSMSSSSIKVVPFEARFQKEVQDMFAEGLQKQPPLALQKWFVASKLEADMGDIYKHYKMSDDKQQGGGSAGYGGLMFWVALDTCSPDKEKIAGCVAMMSSSYGEYDETNVHPMYEGMPGGPRDVCELVRILFHCSSLSL
jgi:GNAT superfamily N-acetyltransferase